MNQAQEEYRDTPSDGDSSSPAASEPVFQPMAAPPESNVIQHPSIAAHASAQALGQVEAAGGNLDKIRDIIFGAQMRDYEKRFARLEDRLLKESGDLRAETERRFDALEMFIKRELSALSDRLKAENRQRDELGGDLSLRLQETTRTLERKLSHLDEQNEQAQRELRQQLLDQAKSLSDEIRRKHEEMSTALAREAGELRHDKTDRAALADLFTEVALRLNNKFHLPGDE